MGHRAQLVLVENNDYHLFDCHWCARNIPTNIFWGVQYAVPYIHNQKPINNHNWMDHVWAEGGVLVDLDLQHLLIFGSELLELDIPLQRIYIELLQQSWTGWDVQWAYDGIADLGAYVGLPRRQFLSNSTSDMPPWAEFPLVREGDHRQINIIGSFIFGDQASEVPAHILPLDELRASDLLCYGPGIVELAKQAPGRDIVSLQDADEFPLAGFHIDVPAKRVEFWSADDPGALDILPPLWPGWELIWLKDNFETHLSRLNNRVIFPAIDTEKLISRLRKALTREDDFNPIQMMQNVIQDRESQGHKVQVNPNALIFAPQDNDAISREQIFDAAVARWRAKRTASL